jgi:hypothetical protein
MTERTVPVDDRPEQVPPDRVLWPDVRLPLATVEPDRRGDRVAEATGLGGVLLASLGAVPDGTQR